MKPEAKESAQHEDDGPKLGASESAGSIPEPPRPAELPAIPDIPKEHTAAVITPFTAPTDYIAELKTGLPPQVPTLSNR